MCPRPGDMGENALFIASISAATLISSIILSSYVGVSELEYEMVSKTIALSMRVQIPLPTPKFVVR